MKLESAVDANGSVDVTINGEKHSFSEADAKNMEVRGGKGNDTIICTGEADKRTLFGIPIGDNNPNLINDGGKGNDFIMGGDGNDQIHGGRGNDFIMGGNGNGNGSDKVYGDQGRDDVYGGQGKDWVQGDSKEQNFLEKIFDMPSKKDSVNERSFLDGLMRGLRG